MKTSPLWSSLALLAAGCAEEPAQESEVHPVWNQERIRALHGLEPVELAVNEFVLGAGTLEALFTRADRKRPDPERDPTIEWMGREYSALAGTVSGPSPELAVPEQLRSPSYVFGLETRTHVLWLHSGAEPRLYSVSSRAGEVLAEGLTLAELEQRYPEFAGFERLGETDLLDY